MSNDRMFKKVGVVHEIGDLKEGVTNEREWKLRSVVIEETYTWKEKKFSDFTQFTCFGNAVDGIADLSIGDKVDVAFTVYSKKNQNKEGILYWGTTCKAISIKKLEEQPVATAQGDDNPDDDLPF